MHRFLFRFLPAVFLAVSVAHAADRYVATTGNDVGDCSNVATPCLTLPYAIAQAVAADTVNVAAGTYAAALVAVNKTLTLRGAQAGVDARSRVATESVLSNSSGMFVTASNVVIDGFTIQDSSNAAFTGFGILLFSGVDGSQVVNNIVQNNITGLGLANAGTTQAVVRHNLFKTNNLTGASNGQGIYSDPFATGAVHNVLIDANAFDGNTNAGIGISLDTTAIGSNFVISNNAFDANGRSIYVFGVTSVAILANTVTNDTAPGDGGLSVAIGAYGAVSGMSILDNVLQNGNRYGIRVNNFLGPGGENTGIVAHRNNVTGFADAGLINEDVAEVDATCNWWGDASGPTNAANPGGSGEVVVGDAVFAPWLLAPAPGGGCAFAASSPVPTLSPLAMSLLILLIGALSFALARRVS